MVEFVLKNDILEFNGKVKQQIAETAIVTKFAPPYACINMDEVENEFFKTQELQPLVWFRYIDDIFFYGIIVRMNLTSPLKIFKRTLGAILTLLTKYQKMILIS